MRTSGILMPVSSLPSPYGIGSLGAEAYRFVDFLAAAGQRYWQILPIGPTGYGDSPYQSFSAFAANPYFIDLDALEQRGLLTHDEIMAVLVDLESLPEWSSTHQKVDVLDAKLSTELSRIATHLGLNGAPPRPRKHSRKRSQRSQRPRR